MIKQYAWHIDKKGYVCCTASGHTNFKQHRIIMNVFDPEVQVDHIYHKHNDNRKSQLRIATNQQNLRNQKINIANTSGKTGVSWSKKKNKWRSYITMDNKQKSLGYYDDYRNTVCSRLEAEKTYFLEFQYSEAI